jgi:hypothetical protein
MAKIAIGTILSQMLLAKRLPANLADIEYKKARR